MIVSPETTMKKGEKCFITEIMSFYYVQYILTISKWNFGSTDALIKTRKLYCRFLLLKRSPHQMVDPRGDLHLLQPTSDAAGEGGGVGVDLGLVAHGHREGQVRGAADNPPGRGKSERALAREEAEIKNKS